MLKGLYLDIFVFGYTEKGLNITLVPWDDNWAYG